MFIQIMNRVMNQAIFQPVAGVNSGQMPALATVSRPATVDRGRRPSLDSKATIDRDSAVPATFQIYASAFNTAVHGR